MPNIRDFYMRSEDDPKFVQDQIEVYDELESCISQIRMTLLTNKGEVLGEPNFGVEMERYLFDFEIDPYALSDIAQEQINAYVTESRKRKIATTPSYLNDERGNKVYVLKVDVEDAKSPFAILYQ